MPNPQRSQAALANLAQNVNTLTHAAEAIGYRLGEMRGHDHYEADAHVEYAHHLDRIDRPFLGDESEYWRHRPTVPLDPHCQPLGQHARHVGSPLGGEFA